jgi:hypothetical protein
MQTATFQGEIQGGRILTGQPLTEFEGKQVVITLSIPDGPSPEDADDRHDTPSPFAPEEPVILEDLGRIRMPRREVTTVHITVVDIGRRPVPVYSSDDEE